jgi:hypothetical protein
MLSFRTPPRFAVAAPFLALAGLGMISHGDDLWRRTFEKDVTSLTLSPAGSVVVQREDGLSALDLNDGRDRWNRADLAKAEHVNGTTVALAETWSTRYAARSVIRRPPQLGQKPRPSHEKATRRSSPQARHRKRANPAARHPQVRNSRNSRSTNAGSPSPCRLPRARSRSVSK